MKNEEKVKFNKLFIILPIIVVVLISIIISVFLIMNNTDYKIEEVTDYLYFKLYQNGKYGVIDKNGNIILQPEYEMLEIPNPSKDVFICYYEYNSELGEYKTKVFNNINQQIYTEYEQILPFMFKEAISKVPYEKSILQYKENGKYGIIDFNGKKIAEARYDSIESLLYKEGTLKVEQNEKYGVINIKGKEIVEIKYDSITADGYYEEQSKYKYAGFITGNKTTEGYRYGYINYRGKTLLQTQYNEVNRVTDIIDKNNVYLLALKNGQAGIVKNKNKVIEYGYEDIEYNKANQLFMVQKNSKQGIINKSGKVIVPVEYEYIMISANKINTQKDGKQYTFDIKGKEQSAVNYNTEILTSNPEYIITINTLEKFGVNSKDGKSIIENKYEYIEYAFLDYFIVVNNGKVGVMNKEENVLINFKYNAIERIDNNYVLQALNSDTNTIDIYNKNIENTATMKNSNIYQINGYIKMLSENDMKYFDKDGNIVSNKQVYENNSLFSINKDRKWGFVNKDNNSKVDIVYDMVTEFNEYGFAGIKKNNKWGVINSKGEILVEPTYKIDWQEPEFINKYYKVDFGYGLEYYTDEIIEEF